MRLAPCSLENLSARAVHQEDARVDVLRLVGIEAELQEIVGESRIVADPVAAQPQVHADVQDAADRFAAEIALVQPGNIPSHHDIGVEVQHSIEIRQGIRQLGAQQRRSRNMP